jgi:hypothetical protein
MTPGTTVAATITVGGTAGELSQNGLTGVGNIDLDAYKVSSNTSAANDTSDSTGAFTLGPITTNGTAIEYIKAQDAKTTPTYRTTYLYPPNPLRADFDGTPVPLIDNTLLGQAMLLGYDQQDTNNGMLVITVNDCNTTMPQGIDGASLSVKQGSTDVGEVLDLGQFVSQAAGVFIVFNVPDGATDVSASYNNMTFPTHTIIAHKKPSGQNTMGTVTATAIPPGPIN